VAEGLLCHQPSLRLSAANAGRLWLETRLLDESRPFRAVRASCSTVPLPHNEVRCLVADRFAPVTSVEASDSQLELYEAVVDQESGEGPRQARVVPESKPRYSWVLPLKRQCAEIARHCCVEVAHAERMLHRAHLRR